MFNRILVPTDFSPPSDAALKYAKTVAQRFGASLHLLHVVEDPYRSSYGAEGYVPQVEGLDDDLIAEGMTRLEKRLRLPDCKDVAATTAAVIGTPAWSIVEYAAAHEIDLIVMGTHGRGGMSHLLMGSVAEKVVQRAPCAVLTVREARGGETSTAADHAAVERMPSPIAMSLADGFC